MSTLLEHSSEQYIANISQFTSTPERQYVIALVEGKQDLAFWKDVFRKYDAKYDVRVATSHDNDPKNSDGKSNMLRVVTPSKLMALCVDADYDLVIDGYSEYTDDIRNNQYIFNTNYYSLENILLQDNHVRKVMSKLKLDANSLKIYSDFMQSFSDAIYNRLVDFLTEVQDGVDNGCSGDDLHKMRNVFHDDLNKLNINIGNYQEMCAKYMNGYAIKYSEEKRHEIEIRLNASNIHKNDCYKAVRGHNMFSKSISILQRLFSNHVNKLYQNAKVKQPTLTNGEFMSSYGSYKTTADLIDSELRSMPVDEVCVPVQLRNRLDAVYS